MTLWLHPDRPLWLWRVERRRTPATAPLACDAILVQDVGLGDARLRHEQRGLRLAVHRPPRRAGIRRCGPVVMSRQNLAQGGAHPWVAHGCLDGAAGFATDAMQLLGPAYRDSGRIDRGRELPERAAAARGRLPDDPVARRRRWRRARRRRGPSSACSSPTTPRPPATPTSRGIDAASRQPRRDFAPRAGRGLARRCAACCRTRRRVAGRPLDDAAIAARYPGAHARRSAATGASLSFFVAGRRRTTATSCCATRSGRSPRRHGAILRSGQGMLLDETTMCATCWMHGVFAALLTHRQHLVPPALLGRRAIPTTSPAPAACASSSSSGGGWRLLAEPSAFEMGLSDCRWIYRLDGRTVTVRAMASGDDPAMQWRVDGRRRALPLPRLRRPRPRRARARPRRPGRDRRRRARRIAFRPDPAWLWGQRYPDAVYHLVTGTPDAIEAIGGDELLYADGRPRGGGFVALRTRPTDGARLRRRRRARRPGGGRAAGGDATRGGVDAAAVLAARRRATGDHVTRGLRLDGGGAERRRARHAASRGSRRTRWCTSPCRTASSSRAAPPGAPATSARGRSSSCSRSSTTRTVKDILRIVFAAAERDARRLAAMVHARALRPDPRPAQPRRRHRLAAEGALRLRRGDRRPRLPRRAGRLAARRGPRGDRAARPGLGACRRSCSPRCASASSPAPTSSATARATGTIRCSRPTRACATGWCRAGRWRCSSSSSTATPRCSTRAGRADEAAELAALAAAMRADFNRHLVRDGTVAGYALFDPGRREPELLLHPTDTRTGLRYSLLPMTRSIIGGLFTAEQAQHHLAAHPRAPALPRRRAADGPAGRLPRRARADLPPGRVGRLLRARDRAHVRPRPPALRRGDGGARRGRGALGGAAGGEPDRRRRAASPTPRRASATPTSAAATPPSPTATAPAPSGSGSRDGTVAADGGWRIYSSGPGLYTNLLVCRALGIRRRFGERVVAPVLPRGLGEVTVEMTIDGRAERWELGGG